MRLAKTQAALDSFFRSVRESRNAAVVAPQLAGIVDIEERSLATRVRLFILPYGLARLYIAGQPQLTPSQLAISCATLLLDPVLRLYLYDPLAAL